MCGIGRGSGGEPKEECIIDLDKKIKSIPIGGFDFSSFSLKSINLLVEYDEEAQVFTCQFPTKKGNIIFQKKGEQNIQYKSSLKKFKTEIKIFLQKYYQIQKVTFSISDEVNKLLQTRESQQTSS